MSRSDREVPLWLPLGLFLAGLSILVMGLSMSSHSYETDATITKVDKRRFTLGDPMPPRPKVSIRYRFVTIDDKELTGTATGYEFRKLKEGDKIKVRYSPSFSFSAPVGYGPGVYSDIMIFVMSFMFFNGCLLLLWIRFRPLPKEPAR